MDLYWSNIHENIFMEFAISKDIYEHTHAHTHTH